MRSLELVGGVRGKERGIGRGVCRSHCEEFVVSVMYPHQTPPPMGRGTLSPYAPPPRRLDPRAFGARPSCPPNEMSGSVTGIADVNTYSIMVHKHTNDAIPLRSNVAHLS